MSSAPHNGANLELHLLGSTRILVNGVPVEERLWTRRKSKALLKILALSPNRQLHREQLLEWLWPETDPDLALNNLHKAIHAARRALEPALKSGADSRFLLTLDQQICLGGAETVWIDAEAFAARAREALKGDDSAAHEAALELYTGDLLEEDRYEEWAAPRREQLRMLARELAASLARLHETRGDLERGLDEYRRLLRFDPVDEEAHRNLMRLYALTGRRHLALQQYQICRDALRKELDAAPEAATVRTYEQIAAGQADLAPPPIESPAPLDAPPQPREQPSRRRVRAAIGIGLLLLLIGLAAWLWQVRSPGEAPIESIAVLPFTASAPDPNVDYLSDGIAESIINSLSQISRLRVTARTTAFRYKNRDFDPLQAGHQMNVAAVITGRLTRQGDSIGIQADLIRVEDGAQLWGSRYDRKMDQITLLQAEIARDLSEKLRAQLTPDEQRRVIKQPTNSAEAFVAYARGRSFWNQRKVADLQRAVEAFQQALRHDPSYALAYAGLADCYTLLSNLQLPPTEAIPLARQAALRALELDDHVAAAHASLALGKWRYEWDWPEAEREFKRAIDLDPSYASAHQWYGQLLTYQQKFDEGLAELKRAQQLDPLSPIITANLGLPRYFARDYDAAITQFRRGFEFQKDFPFGHFFIGWALEMKRQYPEALAEFQQAVEADPTPSAWAYLGHGYAIAGNRAKAEEILGKLRGLAAQRYVSPYYLAIVCVGMREKEQALAYLDKALEDHSDPMVLLGVEPKFDFLRSDPRFQRILQRVGLPSEK